jgi:hypothetical protein
MTRRKERQRPYDQRPHRPDGSDHIPADLAYVKRMLAFRWDQYRHGETGFRDVWFYVSWWMAKVHLSSFIIAPLSGVGTFLIVKALT